MKNNCKLCQTPLKYNQLVKMCFTFPHMTLNNLLKVYVKYFSLKFFLQIKEKSSISQELKSICLKYLDYKWYNCKGFDLIRSGAMDFLPYHQRANFSFTSVNKILRKVCHLLTIKRFIFLTNKNALIILYLKIFILYDAA